MKYRSWLFVLTLISAFLLAACGGGAAEAPAGDTPAGEAPAADTPAEEAPAAGGKTTIIFAHPGEETELTMRPEIIERFMEAHPDIVVEAQPVPPDGYDTQITAQIAAGTPPDVFISGDVQVAHYIKNGVARDLTPFFEADPDLDEDDFYPSVIDFFRGPDGHVYMMPDTIDVQRIYYNKSLFDEAGLDYPTAGWSWDDFKATAAALTKGEGPEKTYGFFADSWWAVWLPYVWQNGGDLISEDGARCILTEDAAVEALEWYGNFIRQGYSPSPEELSGLGMGGWDLFVTGRAAMFQSGGWDIPGFEEEANFEWAMVPLPKGKQDATFLHLTNYVMAAETQNPEAAWEFMKFLASPEVYTLEASVYGWGVPPRPDVAESFASNPPSEITPMNALNVEVGQISAEYGRLPTKILNWDEFTGDGVDVGLERFWSGEISAAEAAEAACAVTPEPAEQ